MITEQQIIDAIQTPQKNRFVSQERFDRRKVRVRSESITTERLKELAGQIRDAESAFLDSVYKENGSVETFLNDKRITPSPETNLSLTPYLQADTLAFTVACLAPKAANPQKADQGLPDLGELALLIHFEELARVASKYGKPVEFTLLTEGQYLQQLDNFDPERVRAFDQRVQQLSKEIVGNQRVRLREWYDSVAMLPGYHEEYTRQRAELAKQLAENPAAIEREFLAIVPTEYMTIHPADADTKAIYSLRRGEARSKHIQATTEATLNLMAFNRAKKVCGERDILYPNHVYGSLTPGEGKFAFYAIGPWNKRYPTHGMGVLDDKARVSIVYAKNLVESPHAKNLRTRG